VAVDGVEQPREAEAEDGTGEERREDDLLLPQHISRLAHEEPHRYHYECHETYNQMPAAEAKQLQHVIIFTLLQTVLCYSHPNSVAPFFVGCIEPDSGCRKRLRPRRPS